MKKFNGTMFVKQDILRVSTFVFWAIGLLAGFGIFSTRNNAEIPFQIEHVLAGFSAFAMFLIIYISTNLFGKEFNLKTINMIKISNKSSVEILIYKWISMMSLCLISAILSLAETIICAQISDYKLDVIDTIGKVLLAYFLFGTFMFTLATVVVMIVKKSTFSFLIVFAIMLITPSLITLLYIIKGAKRVFEYIPLSFIGNSFTSADFSTSQIIVTLAWSTVLFIVANILFKKRGHV